MAVRSVQDQATSLLQRRVAEAKTRGSPTPDVEAAALLESVALNLLLSPRTVLYVANLARYGLLKVVNSEVAALGELKKTISDLANVSYAIKDTRSLEKAKNSLLQLENQERVSTESNDYKRFSSAVDDFLNKQLSKNVRRPGVTDLVRPGAEAAQDLPSEFSTVNDYHQDLLDRLYALAVGVDNFQTTPFGALLGQSISARSRRDIEDIISTLEVDDSASTSRDIAIRLITDRSAVRLLGSTPSLYDEALSSTKSLPEGYSVTGESAAAAAVDQGTVPAPVALPTSAYLTFNQTAPTVSINIPSFPHAGFHLNNRAHFFGSPVAYPVSIPADTHLFLRVRTTFTTGFTQQPDGTFNHGTVGNGWLYDHSTQRYWKEIRAPLNTSSSPTSLSLSTVLSSINTALLFVGVADEFPSPGTGRLLISANSNYYDTIGLLAAMSEPEPSGTLGLRRTFSNSAHEILGLNLSQYGESGLTPLSTLITSLTHFLGGSVSVVAAPDNSIRLTSLSTATGVSITVGGNAAPVLGLSGTFHGLSDTLSLKGTVLGVQTDPVSPVDLVDVGDSFTTPFVTAKVAEVSGDGIRLDSASRTFDGNVSATSALNIAWDALNSSLKGFLETWTKTSYAIDLKKVDAAIAAVAGSPTAARRNAAIAIIDDLLVYLTDLVSALTVPSSLLPTGSATKERALVDGIISTLSERKFDRALDFFLRCQIQELFEMDWQSASFGGQMLQSATAVAQSDVRFPNIAKEEGNTANSFQPRSGRS